MITLNILKISNQRQGFQEFEVKLATAFERDKGEKSTKLA